MGACVGSSFASNVFPSIFPFALSPGHGVSSSSGQSGSDLTRRRGGELRNYADGDETRLNFQRSNLRYASMFDTLLNTKEAYRVFHVGCYTAKMVVPWPDQTLRNSDGDHQVIDVELPCFDDTSAFDINWKRQDGLTLVINCNASTCSVWLEVLNKRVLTPVGDGAVDLDHVPLDTDGRWGIIFC